MRAARAERERKFRSSRTVLLAIASACLASVFLVGLSGCALAGNPQPPTLWLPAPVKDLTAVRAGNQVHLHWTMPRLTTDKVLLNGDQHVHFCWSSAQGPRTDKQCSAAGDGMFAPQKQADFSLPLPAELTSGVPRTVAFFVELQNHAGKTAGPSNPAMLATGAPPPRVTGLAADTRAEGVVLHWDKAASEPGLVMRIHREMVKAAAVSKPDEALGAAPTLQQTLEVNLDQADTGMALDRGANLDRAWRYTAERVLHVEADQQTLEIAGAASAPLTIDAKDVFPPQVPQGLAAVADAQAHAIDLSWMPDAETDLAGYLVDRRDVTSGATPERISGSKPVVGPAFSDTTAVPGHRYAYSVRAVDRDGNQSPRSEEVEEELPQ